VFIAKLTELKALKENLAAKDLKIEEQGKEIVNLNRKLQLKDLEFDNLK